MIGKLSMRLPNIADREPHEIVAQDRLVDDRHAAEQEEQRRNHSRR